MVEVCDVCGNDRREGSLVCSYCGNKHEKTLFSKERPKKHRVINLEIGKPIVEEAMNKLEQELERARNEGVAVVTIIHGYGSSGRGGKIRLECRKILDFLEAKRKIRQAIHGEKFSRKNGQTKSLLRRLPALSKDDNLNRANRGITVVEM